MSSAARIGAMVFVAALLVVSVSAQAHVCGDGVVDAGETCDPPNLALDPVTGQVLCRTDCTSCGDGVVDVGDHESCDAGPHPTCGWCLGNCTWRLSQSNACPCAFDDPNLADVRADVLASCECATASSHGSFLRCARARLALVSADRVAPACAREALKCLAHSVCGRSGAVTCCRTNSHGGRRCDVKSQAAKCIAPPGGSASLGVSENCCDACP